MAFICSAFISGSLISPVSSPCVPKHWAPPRFSCGVSLPKKTCAKSDLSSARLSWQSCPVLSGGPGGGTCGCPQTGQGPGDVWMRRLTSSQCCGCGWWWLKGGAPWASPPSCHKVSCLCLSWISPQQHFPTAGDWWWMEQNVWASPWYPWAVQRCSSPNLRDFNTTLFFPCLKHFKTGFIFQNCWELFPENGKPATEIN